MASRTQVILLLLTRWLLYGCFVLTVFRNKWHILVHTHSLTRLCYGRLWSCLSSSGLPPAKSLREAASRRVLAWLDVCPGGKNGV